MENETLLKVLLVAEGSGGHIIPALQVAGELTKAGVCVALWYSELPQTKPLVRELIEDPARDSYEVSAVLAGTNRNWLIRLWRCGRLWSRSQSFFDTFKPDVVVGFGGLISAPVVLAARRRGINCLLHEQNVTMGSANRVLARLVDRVTVSFSETEKELNGTPSVITGLPVRPDIGQKYQNSADLPFGFKKGRPTLLILGGSQGAKAVNRIVLEMVEGLSSQERARWQLLHITGLNDEALVRCAYERLKITSWVTPYLTKMDLAYDQADVVVARAGASTIAELALCGKPAVLIPYPHANGHQRVNASMVESLGGAVAIEEGEATAQRLSSVVRALFADSRLRTMMGDQLRGLCIPDAANRVAHTIVGLATKAKEASVA